MDASTTCGDKAPLTPAELAERLRLSDPLLVAELHQATLRRLAFEAELAARIEQRASSLIGQCGIAVTVALGVNGLLLKSADAPLVPPKACPWVAIGFFLVIALGPASTVCATLVTRYRRFTLVHLRRIAAELTALNEEKAVRLRLAQALFTLFLVLVGVAGFALTFVVIRHGQAG